MIHVVIAIVGYRNHRDIIRCLGALAESTYRDFELFICENGGPEAYEALMAELPPALPTGQPIRSVLAPGNLGFAGGVNRCLEETPDAEAWWVLNPDTQPDPSALEALVARLEVGDCEAVGGTLYLPNGMVQAYGGQWRSWLARAVSIGSGTALGEPPDQRSIETSLSYLIGASMLISRRFLQVVGPMREEYFLYCEETEWFLRGIERGMRLGFAPGARVKHALGTTTGAGRALKDQPRLPVYLLERNKILVTRDRFPSRLMPAALCALILVFMRYASRGAWPQLRYSVAGWWAGVRNERGAPAHLFR